MPANHVEIRNFIGLYAQPNSFQLPDGALELVRNCTISNTATITGRRGQFTFHSPSSGTLNNLFNYQDVLLALYNDKLLWLNSTGSPFLLTGETVLLSAGRVGRSAQQNKNLYFTTDNGVLKITAFNSTIARAGVASALDLVGDLYTGTVNPIADTKQVGYRVVFGLEDANKNLLLGAPSDFLILHNGTGSAKAARLEFSVPSELNSSFAYFYQVYRSSQATFPDDPDVDYRLIDQVQVNFGALAAANRRISYNDDIDDNFRLAAAELYTNPNSREGELQANTPPPLATDITSYRNHTLYANSTLNHQLIINLINAQTIANNDTITITQDAGVTNRVYVARTGIGNTPTLASVSGTTTMTITITAHGFVNGDAVYIFNANGAIPIAEAAYTVTSAAANTFVITANAGANSTACMVEGLSTASSNYMFTKYVDPGLDHIFEVDVTASSLVRAINRDPFSTVIARYLSSNSATPGQILLQSKTFSSVPVQIKVSSSTTGSSFSPILPTAYSTLVESDNFVGTNIVYVSKIGEPEAVPIVNQIEVGSKNKAILRIFALKDSVVVIKEDGVFRIDGDRLENFISTIIDNTVFCLAASSASLLNNQVYFLSNQGVCSASATSVQIVSRNIELPITAVLGNSALAANTSGFGYESDRLYILTTLAPLQSTASEVYVYNTLTNAWSTWDKYFKQGVVGPGDRLYTISTGNVVMKERKNQNKLDYCDESFIVNVVSVASDKLSAVITSTSSVIEQGDIIEKLSVISRVKTSTLISGSNYAVTFEGSTNMAALDAITLYKKYIASVKIAPYHGGMVCRGKQFSQMQVHTRDGGITYLEFYFATDKFFSSEVTSWRASDIGGVGDGWGNQPWGSFPWGQDSGIDLQYTTLPAPIIRTFIPQLAQRTTWIQAVLDHKMAAEALNIQAISFTVRGYGERVTR